jgi:hypothetical protein
MTTPQPPDRDQPPAAPFSEWSRPAPENAPAVPASPDDRTGAASVPEPPATAQFAPEPAAAPPPGPAQGPPPGPAQGPPPGPAQGWGPQPAWTGASSPEGYYPADPALGSEPPRRHTGIVPLALTAAGGLVVGGLIVGLVWAASSSLGGDKSDADADAEAACAIFERLPETWSQDTFDLANSNRVAAAFALSASAAQDDKKYQPLATVAQSIHQAVVTFQVDTLGARIQDARNQCAEQ